VLVVEGLQWLRELEEGCIREVFGHHGYSCFIEFSRISRWILFRG
jgi:hypothetical protein